MRVVLEDIEDSGEFAKLLEEQEKREEVGQIKSGKIIAVQENGVLVDVGEKVEGFLGLSEVANKDGEILFKVGDVIDVFVSNGRGERPNVSYKKALKVSKIRDKILELGSDFKDKVIEGKIIHKNKGGYIVESDGVDYFMPKHLAALKDPNKSINKSIRACIIDVRAEENSIIISRKRFFEIDDKRQEQGIKKLLDSNEIQTGIVKSIANFGIFVEVDGVRGLVHYTEISHKGPINPAKIYKEGDEVKLKVIGYDEDKKRLSFSIKATSEDPWKDIQNEIKKGYTLKVVVSNLESYGAFVNIGNGIEGFLHVSEISWDKDIKHPKDYLQIGQEINVEVIEVDVENKRLRVSLKNLNDKPFDEFAKNHKVGDEVEGKIVTLTDFGAFVSLGGVDGLLHNEDAFWEKGQKCKDKFKIGDSIKTKILRIDNKNERISLSLRALTESPAEIFSKTHKLDSIVKGNVVDIKDFGVFIKIDEMDALIKNEDLYPLKKEELKMGDEIEGVLISIDKQNNRIRVSVKKLERQKQKEEIKAFNSDDKLTLGDLLKDKI